MSSAATASPSPPATPGRRESFVGSDYGFRTYFTRAMAEGAAQQYALGTVSGRPGLYLSRRVDSVLGPLGVVVVKVEFDDVEARWRESGLVVQVTDAAGVVLATTDPAWRFGTTRPARRRGGHPRRPAARRRAAGPGADQRRGRGPGADRRQALRRRKRRGRPLRPGLAPRHLPAGRAEPRDRGAQRAGDGAARRRCCWRWRASCMLRRRRWALARQAALAAMNAELERRVARRTEELNRSNAALAGEIAEREAAETRARRLRDDLAQANRLSILGQVSAGVAHEINQPLAAIRAYAETGGRLLDAGQPARGARQPPRDRRRHRPDRGDHPGAARLLPPRRRRDPAGRGRGGGRRRADAARRAHPRRRRRHRPRSPGARASR